VNYWIVSDLHTLVNYSYCGIFLVEWNAWVVLELVMESGSWTSKMQIWVLKLVKSVIYVQIDQNTPPVADVACHVEISYWQVKIIGVFWVLWIHIMHFNKFMDPYKKFPSSCAWMALHDMTSFRITRAFHSYQLVVVLYLSSFLYSSILLKCLSQLYHY
jgi:hypothetical protein